MYSYASILRGFKLISLSIIAFIALTFFAEARCDRWNRDCNGGAAIINPSADTIKCDPWDFNCNGAALKNPNSVSKKCDPWDCDCNGACADFPFEPFIKDLINPVEKSPEPNPQNKKK